MRAQQATVAEIERVVHGPRRVVRREIQRFEIVMVGLDLGAGCHVEAELGEDGDGPVHGQGHRVQAATFFAAPGQGDVDFLAEQFLLERLRFEQRSGGH